MMESRRAANQPGRANNPPDFLVKLLAMVKEDHEDPRLITWDCGKVFIQDPVALEKKMPTYFRHSNFSSFQRQLNNFGFRKVEGKGKLAPCIYMHDDLQGKPPDSLLNIRRKAPSGGQPPPGSMIAKNGTLISSSWPAASTRPMPALADAAKRRRTDVAQTVQSTQGLTQRQHSNISLPSSPGPPERAHSFGDDRLLYEQPHQQQHQQHQQAQQPQQQYVAPPTMTQPQPVPVHQHRHHQERLFQEVDQDALDDAFATADNVGRPSSEAHEPFDTADVDLINFLDGDPTATLPSSQSMPFFDPVTEVRSGC